MRVIRYPTLKFHSIPNNFAVGIKVSLPDLRPMNFNFGPFSGYLESVFHYFKQECLKATIFRAFEKSRLQIVPLSSFFRVKNASFSYKVFGQTQIVI